MSETKEPTMAELYSSPTLNVKRKRRWGGILIFLFFGGLVAGVDRNVNLVQGTTALLYGVSAIIAPNFYYRLKPRIKIIKNNFLRSFIVGIFVVIVFAVLSSVLGAIGSVLIYQYLK